MNGHKVHPDVRFLVVPATPNIMAQALDEGHIQTFVKAGAMVGVPCCGPCGGYGMGAMAADEVCVTSGSRNFVGRLGSPRAKIYLGSPATAAASAIAGKVVDPRSLGKEK
jgi:3-isopropylmalate/(R)-2-methylmalate dehydratase large subunit